VVPYGHERRKGVFLLKLRFSEKAKKCEENPILVLAGQFYKEVKSIYVFYEGNNI
jgi:hypothetical protein